MITLGAKPLFDVTAGTAPIALIGLVCVGIELRLMDCVCSLFARHDCDHSDDVGVRCLAASPGPGAGLYLWQCQALSCLITQQTIILYKRILFLINTSELISNITSHMRVSSQPRQSVFTLNVT